MELYTDNGDSSSLRDAIWLFMDEWRWIVAIGTMVVLAALAYAYTAEPIYRTTALLQIEDRERGPGGVDELAWLSTTSAPTAAEIEILSSRMVLNEAIEQENLNLVVAPIYVPVVGHVVARHRAERFARGRWPPGYAWGGERLRVDRLDVAPGLADQALTLVAKSEGRYTLLGPDGEKLLTGGVGVRAQGRGAALFVSELKAHAGARFLVMKQNELATFKDLQERLSIAERGQQTGILELSLEGTNPEEVMDTLTAITNIYLRQNVERRSVEAARSLEFLNRQLPLLRAQADAAEHALNQFRSEKGSVDMSLETQGMLEQLTEVERRLSEMELERVERSRRFTPQHPAMIALDEQQRELEEVRATLATQIRALPEAEQDALRLTRDARVANELYTLLLNRAQELRVVQAGTVGNARIIDQAFQPRWPVKPRKPLILGIGIVLGGMLGVSSVLLRQTLQTGIRDPKDLEQHFDLPVYAIVPRSRGEARARSGRFGRSPLLAVASPDDPAVESLRSLRTSLEFLLHEAPNRIVAIGSAAPDMGKSFITANLGVVMAQAGGRVLIVDADLRRGHLHRRFGLPRTPGLSELIIDQTDLGEALRDSGHEGLRVLPTGRLPPNPAELMISRRFPLLVSELADRHDLLLIDAPPIMAASEAVHLARLAGVNLLVVRSGRQQRREIELMLDRLVQGTARASGFVFNDLPIESRRNAYAGYRYYRYSSKPGRGRR
ncbi:MAG TPA: polysaccharide biosynthesis tyrosine autokinase [Gammaproteobacteria bacterium]